MPRKKKTDEETIEVTPEKVEKTKSTKKATTKAKTTTTKKTATKKSTSNNPTEGKPTSKKKEEAKKVEDSADVNETSNINENGSNQENDKEIKTENEIKIDPNLRYSDEDLAEFEEIIQMQKKETIDEIGMLRERLEDLNSEEAAEESMVYSMHMAEQGSEALEKEKTYAQIQRQNEYLKKLDEALLRIKDKTYGICRKCGILIAKERLKLVPITTLSASYKIHQECPEDGIDRISAAK